VHFELNKRSYIVFLRHFNLANAQRVAIVTTGTAGTAYRLQNKCRYAVYRTVPTQIIKPCMK